MKFIKSIASALLCAIATSGYSFPSGTYTNTFVRNGTTYVQRGQLKPSDYVVTNVNITAESIDALPLVEDSTGAKTAVTIGSRSGTVGPYSLANGNNVTASGQGSHAEGLETVASGVYSRADGMFTEALGPGSYAFGYMAKTLPSHRHAFVWNGIGYSKEKYPSNGEGTFNINPISGANGFYIGDKTLAEIFYTKDETDAKVAEAAPGNRNYVQIGTNAYATAREDGGAIAIGENAKSLGYRSISIGGGTELHKAVAEKSGSIQLGSGVNSSNNTFQVYGYRMLDANGYIPKERIAQTTLMLYDEKNSLTWQMGVDPNTGDMMWYAVTNVDITGTVRSIPEDKNYVPIPIQ